MGPAGWQRAFKQGLWAGLGIFFVVAWAGAFLERLFPVSAELQPFARMVLEAETGSEMFLLFFLGAVLAPLGEEVYFRGFLYPSLKRHLGIFGGIVVSGMVFGMLHFDLFRFFPLALGGIGLAFLYENPFLVQLYCSSWSLEFCHAPATSLDSSVSCLAAIMPL